VQHHDLSPQPADLHYTCNLLKALADETRLQLVLHLLEQEWSVSGLVSRLSLPQSTVSRHLGVLRHAGIVATRRDGTSVYYRLADAHLGDLVRQAFAHAEHKRLGLPDHGSTSHPVRKDRSVRKGGA
jgi:DNA-binding transcriptional ArsR family regulator